MPLAPNFGAGPKTPEAWDLGEFVQSCARVAGERVLAQRMKALVNRLLVEADQRGFPLTLLNDRTAETARLDWEERTTRAVVDALTEVEREATRPTGWRKYARGAVGLLGNALPELVLVGSIIVILYLFIVEQWVPTLAQMLIPLYMTLGVLVLMHVVILTVLPVRWTAIRGEFRSRLAEKLRDEFGRTFLPVPDELAAAVAAEKKQVEEIAGETRQVADWLRDREEAAHVGELYGR